MREGVYRTNEPIPVHGTWKAEFRLHTRPLADRRAGLPPQRPGDPGQGGARARESFERPFVRDKDILQREAKDGAAGLTLLGYGIVLAITLSIIALNAWALVRLATVIEDAGRRRPPSGSAAPPPRGSRCPRHDRAPRRKELRLHGHPVAYYAAGSGPVLLLIHGITSSADAWRSVLPALAEHHTVIAPDLLGHGGSAKPRGDYSLGAYASGLRDLLAALGHERATVVGHSMGGGIAMQLAYQFPERVERLALVSSGGLGSEVGLVLRAATLPGADWCCR